MKIAHLFLVRQIQVEYSLLLSPLTSVPTKSYVVACLSSLSV